MYSSIARLIATRVVEKPDVYIQQNCIKDQKNCSTLASKISLKLEIRHLNEQINFITMICVTEKNN